MTTTPTRRKHSTGEATRELLMVTAERLFALHGVEGVTLREVQRHAGQSNSSVITYHFGSKAGLVRALIDYRYRTIDARRLQLYGEARQQGAATDPRTVVWVIVRPLVESIEAGEMFVPFLARVSENFRTRTEFWPRRIDESSADILKQLVSGALSWLPERARPGRESQLHISVLNVLGEHARNQRPLGAAQLHNYVDGWVGMLSAPASAQTIELMT